MRADARRPFGWPAAAAVRIGRLRGWRRNLAAFGFGVVAAAAQPPVLAIPCLAVGFAGLAWLLKGARRRRGAFVDGWMFGAGYFAAGLHWVSNALLVEASRFAWMIPPAVLGLSFGLALFAGLATLSVRLASPRRDGRENSLRSEMTEICLLAAAWTVAEWLRGWMFTGFPWNPIGAVWTGALPVLQTASWIGVLGLSLVTVYAAGAFSVLVAPARHRWPAALSGAALLAALGAAGALRLDGAPAGHADGIRLRVVQPDVPQREKIRPELRLAAFVRLAEMSGEGGAVTHVVWPESAVPLSMLLDPRHRPLLRRATPPGGFLITGTVRVRRGDDGRLAAWNSVVGIDDAGEVAGTYDKHHLVPFGEYVPFRGILPVDRVVPGALDFSRGPGPRTLDLAGLPPFSPLVCYEAIFPGAVVDETGPRPAWLLNVTNDAWFGTSVGPHQHFAAARMRAVEEGLPLVRAANTGISGVVDAYGRVVRRLGLGTRGTIDAALPLPTETVYARFGDGPALLAALLILGAGLAMNGRRKRGGGKSS